MGRNDGSIGENATNSRRAKRHPLNLTLAGLPELGYFASAEEREQVLREIAAGGALKTWQSWFATGLLVAIVFGAVAILWWLMSLLLRLVAWPLIVENGLRMAGLVLGSAVSIRHMTRSVYAKPLRDKLLDRGIPICLKCGYLLHGLPLTSERCPECGRAFDERVREILHGNSG